VQAVASAHLINSRFLQPSRLLGLDPEWEGRNGLRGLCSTVLKRSEAPLGRMTAVGGGSAAGAARIHAKSNGLMAGEGGAPMAVGAEGVACGPGYAVGTGMSRRGECAGGACRFGAPPPHLHVHILVQLA
jgi:hypothetical protein